MRRLALGMAAILAGMVGAATIQQAASADPVVAQSTTTIERAPGQFSGPTILGPSTYPPVWTLRLYNSPDYPAPPSRYDIYLPNVIMAGGLMSVCVELWGGWDNQTLSAFLNAPGVAYLYADHNCYGAYVAKPNCTQTWACYQAKTCNWPRYGPAYGDWYNRSGELCAKQDGQTSSVRWFRWLQE